jgi:hypothetical protein
MNNEWTAEATTMDWIAQRRELVGDSLPGTGGAVCRQLESPPGAAYSEVRPLILGLQGQGLSFRAIAAELNEQGHHTRRGAAWNAVQVKRIVDHASIKPADTIGSAQG